MLAIKQGEGIFEMMSRDTINNLLRKEITNSKESRYRTSQGTGINESQLSSFYHGASLSSENASILLDYFGYEIRKKKSKGRKRK